MNFQLPCRIRFQPANKLVGYLFKNKKVDVVVQSHGKLVRLYKVDKSAVEALWITGIECISIPMWHSIKLEEEMP